MSEVGNQGTETPEVGSSDHDKKMIEVADSANTEEAVRDQNASEGVDSSLEFIPEKYHNAENPLKAFLEGHKELEKKLGSSDEQDAIKEEEEKLISESESELSEEDQAKVDEEAIKSGDLTKFYEEWAETGTLSEESYKELDSHGYSKDLVDTYIKGYKAQVLEITREAHEIVGGEDNYEAMVKWSSEHLTPEEQKAYNGQLTQGKEQWELALRGLNDKFQKSGDAPVERIRSEDKPVVEGIKAYLSQAEVTKAIGDPRYATDPAYREEVKQRLNVSDNDAMGAVIHSSKRVAQFG